MKANVVCQSLLLALVIGGVVYGAGMPGSINNDRDLNHALKTARTPEDHAMIADYYKSKADQLDAVAAGYEQAAASLRGAPVSKNIVAPNTAARYEITAKSDREEANSYRILEASQREAAKTVTMASK